MIEREYVLECVQADHYLADCWTEVVRAPSFPELLDHLASPDFYIEQNIIARTRMSYGAMQETYIRRDEKWLSLYDTMPEHKYRWYLTGQSRYQDWLKHWKESIDPCGMVQACSQLVSHHETRVAIILCIRHLFGDMTLSDEQFFDVALSGIQGDSRHTFKSLVHELSLKTPIIQMSLLCQLVDENDDVRWSVYPTLKMFSNILRNTISMHSIFDGMFR